MCIINFKFHFFILTLICITCSAVVTSTALSPLMATWGNTEENFDVITADEQVTPVIHLSLPCTNVSIHYPSEITMAPVDADTFTVPFQFSTLPKAKLYQWTLRSLTEVVTLYLLVVPGVPDRLILLNTIETWFSCEGGIPVQPRFGLFDRALNRIQEIPNTLGAVTASLVISEAVSLSGQVRVPFENGEASFLDLYLCGAQSVDLQFEYVSPPDSMGEDEVPPDIRPILIHFRHVVCPSFASKTAYALSPKAFLFVPSTPIVITVTGRAFPYHAKRNLLCIWGNYTVSVRYYDVCHFVCTFTPLRPYTGPLYLSLTERDREQQHFLPLVGEAMLSAVGPIVSVRLRMLLRDSDEEDAILRLRPGVPMGLPPIEIFLLDENGASLLPEENALLLDVAEISLRTENAFGSEMRFRATRYRSVVSGLVAVLPQNASNNDLNVSAVMKMGSHMATSTLLIKVMACPSLRCAIDPLTELQCSGHGRCLGGTLCQCYPGWRGENCNTGCPGISPDDATLMCSGHGECLDDGTCECLPGYYTSTCDKKCTVEGCQRTLGMLHTTCDERTGTCVCRDHYAGPHCDVCERGWIGLSDCKKCDCGSHGECSLDERAEVTCVCHASAEKGYWEGSDCTSCQLGYYGIDCRQRHMSALIRYQSFPVAIRLQQPHQSTDSPPLYAVDTEYHMAYYGSIPPLCWGMMTTEVKELHGWENVFLRGVHFVNRTTVLLVGEDLTRKMRFGLRKRTDLQGLIVESISPEQSESFASLSPRRSLLQLQERHTVFGNLIDTVDTVSGFTLGFYTTGYVIPFQRSPYLLYPSSSALVPESWGILRGVVVCSPHYFAYGSGTHGSWMLLRFQLNGSLITNVTNMTAKFYVDPCQKPACTSIDRCMVVSDSKVMCVLSRSSSAVGIIFPSSGEMLASGIIAVASTAAADTKVTAGPMAYDNSTKEAYFVVTIGSMPSSIYKFTLLDTQLQIKGMYAFTTLGAHPEVVTAMMVYVPSRSMTVVVTVGTLTRNDVLYMFSISRLVPDVIDSAGGAFLTVIGEGFNHFPNALCVFGTAESPALAVNVTTLVCRAPRSLSSTGDVCSTEAFYVKLGAAVQSTTFTVRRPATPFLKSLTTDNGEFFTALNLSTVITVKGLGFFNSPYLTCRIASTSFATITMRSSAKTALFVSPSIVMCHHAPIRVMSQGSTNISVSLDGTIFSNALEYSVVGPPVRIKISRPDPSSILALASATRMRLPLIEIYVIDRNENRVGKFDSDRRLFVVRDISQPLLSEGSQLWSGASVNGYLSLNFYLERPRATFVHLRVVDFHRPEWFVDLRIRVVAGKPTRIIPNMTQEELDGWVVGGGRRGVIPLKPDPRMYVVDPGDNVIVDPDVLPRVMTLSYAHAKEVITSSNGVVVLKSQNWLVQVRARPMEGLYSFVSAMTLGYFGQTYIFSFGVDASFGIPSYETKPIAVGNCTKHEYAQRDTLNCKRCPQFGICDGGTAVDVEEGYWRPSDQSVTFYSCKPPYSDSSCSKGTCLPGYTGIRCSSCEVGYGKSGLTCSKCRSRLLNILEIIAYIILAALFLALIVWSIGQGPRDQLPVLIKMLTTHCEICGQLGDFATVLSPLLLSFYNALKRLISATSPSILFQALDCEARLNYFDHFIITMVSPFALASLIFLVLLAKKIYYWFSKLSEQRVTKVVPYKIGEHFLSSEKVIARREEILEIPGGWTKTTLHGKARFREIVRKHIAGCKEKTKTGRFVDIANYVRLRGYMNALDRHQTTRIFILSLVILLFFMYPMLIEEAIAVLTCDKVDLGGGQVRWTLIADSSIECFTSQHNYYSYWALTGGTFYAVGFPIFLLCGIRLIGFIVQDMNVACVMFSFMTSGFKSTYWFWETVILARKALMIGITVFVTNELLRTYLAMWLLTGFVALNSFFLPYTNQMLSRVEIVSLSANVLTLNLGLLFRHYSSTHPIYIITNIFLLTVNAFIIFLFLILIVRSLGPYVLAGALWYPQASYKFFKKHTTLAMLIDYPLPKDAYEISSSSSDSDYENEADRAEKKAKRKEMKRVALAQKQSDVKKKVGIINHLLKKLGLDETKENLSHAEMLKKREEVFVLLAQRRNEKAAAEKRKKEGKTYAFSIGERWRLITLRDKELTALAKAESDLVEVKELLTVATERLIKTRIRRKELEAKWAAAPKIMMVAEVIPKTEVRQSWPPASRDKDADEHKLSLIKDVKHQLAVTGSEALPDTRTWTTERLQAERDAMRTHRGGRRGGGVTPEVTIPSSEAEKRDKAKLTEFAFMFDVPVEDNITEGLPAPTRNPDPRKLKGTPKDSDPPTEVKGYGNMDGGGLSKTDIMRVNIKAALYALKMKKEGAKVD